MTTFSLFCVFKRLQTFPSPGDHTHQPPTSQTSCCCCLATHRPAGPPPPQPQPRHPQLHPAEPGPHLRLQPRKRLRRAPDSRVCPRPVQPADSAAERHGLLKTRVARAHPAVFIRATGGPDQSATGKNNRRHCYYTLNMTSVRSEKVAPYLQTQQFPLRANTQTHLASFKHCNNDTCSYK